MNSALRRLRNPALPQRLGLPVARTAAAKPLTSPRRPIFAALRDRIQIYWHELTGEARADLARALEEAQAEEVKALGLVGTFRRDLEAATAAAEPEIKAALGVLAQQLEADLTSLIRGAAPA